MIDVRKSVILALFAVICNAVQAQSIKGCVTDAQTKEPLIGATVEVKGTTVKTVTDVEGNFSVSGLKKGARQEVIINYVGYKTLSVKDVPSVADEVQDRLSFAMTPDVKVLGEVSVVAAERRNTNAAVIQLAKNSAVVVNNVSAQEIKLTQDANAGEVIKRIPGVSLIEDKFVMVRGLSQRYNNVWINGGAVPSTEADSRAFSFDLIPSSQIESLTIVKSPSAEYPADYTGGFIIVNTQEIPSTNSFSVSIGGGWNDATHWQNFMESKGSGTDFLGFDGGLRSLDGGIGAPLNSVASSGTSLTGNGLNNDWFLKQFKPFADMKLSASMNHSWRVWEHRLGLLAALNYTNEYRTYSDMTNNLFGVYDVDNDCSNYLRRSTDNQYNHNVKVGAMLNMTLLTVSGKHKYQFKNIFNQIGNNRYTWREGISAQSNLENSAEYYYRSRTTYNTQLTGKHNLGGDNLDWSLGYAYANRHIPDRRRYLVNDALETGVFAWTASNDASREWTQLDEHIFSAAVNDKHQFSFGTWTPSLQAGAYWEHRSRDYKTRNFIYNWNYSDNNLPQGFRYMDIPTLLSDEQYMGEDGFYLLEQLQMRNNYRGKNTLAAGYFTVDMPFGKLGIHAGLRYEMNDMELISNTRDTEVSEMSTHYKDNDLFPSINATYKFNDKHQMRLSYGRSVNRPEFREVSSSVYYDFDLASSVQGNTELRNCYIDNIDLRYEFYPSRGEQISIAAFYKRFDSPIEWTYTVAGGTDLVYSYKNALSADSYGIELDIRKSLDFIGLPDFSWSFNGALIKSSVNFEDGAREKDRPMQGQSPYLINTGVFYKNQKAALDVALLYNRIGKRIIGVGRSSGSTGSDDNARVPDSYEMPRNTIDLSVTKRIADKWEIKFNVRDLLAEKVQYKQFADVIQADGTTKEVEQVTRSYKPGRNIGLQVTYKF